MATRGEKNKDEKPTKNELKLREFLRLEKRRKKKKNDELQ